MIRILLADDHDVVRHGLRGLLEIQPGWQVVGEASTGREAINLAAELVPDIAIIDLAMPELNGLEATRQIRKELPGIEVLIFTMHQSEQLLREVLRAGARGYLLKSDAAERLVPAVAAVAAHRPYFSAFVSEALLAFFVREETSPGADGTPGILTGREREIVQMLAEGQGNREIGEALAISVKTVETHRAAILRKLGLGSLAELVRYAIRNQIIEP